MLWSCAVCGEDAWNVYLECMFTKIIHMLLNLNELLNLPQAAMCAAHGYFLERYIEQDLNVLLSKFVQEVINLSFKLDTTGCFGRCVDLSRQSAGNIRQIKHDGTAELKELTELVEKSPFKKELFI